MGPDGIHPKVLKECAGQITGLFNLSLSSGNVAESWRMPNVSPIFKKGQ